MDKVEADDTGLKKLEKCIQTMAEQLGINDAKERIARLTLYCPDVHNNSDLRSNQPYQRIHEIDRQLCYLWKEMLNPGFIASRVFTPPPNPPQPEIIHKYVEKQSKCEIL